mgnify:CR=1 FL=1
MCLNLTYCIHFEHAEPNRKDMYSNSGEKKKTEDFTDLLKFWTAWRGFSNPNKCIVAISYQNRNERAIYKAGSKVSSFFRF